MPLPPSLSPSPPDSGFFVLSITTCLCSHAAVFSCDWRRQLNSGPTNDWLWSSEQPRQKTTASENSFLKNTEVFASVSKSGPLSLILRIPLLDIASYSSYFSIFFSPFTVTLAWLPSIPGLAAIPSEPLSETDEFRLYKSVETVLVRPHLPLFLPDQ